MSKSSTMQRNLTIAQLGVLSALIIVMTFVPYIGYITYGVLSITLIHIPVIIGACVLGPGGGAALGIVWGVTCVIKAFTFSSLEGIIFRNPLVAVIPRLIAGFAAGLVFMLVSKLATKNKTAAGAKSHIASTLAAITGCLCNTIFVMGSIYLVYGTKYGTELGITSVSFGGLTKYILAAFSLNAVVEILAAIAIAVPVSYALRKVKTKI